jgi:phosphatidylserine/phosphatidylglycerophosphate/cardiolipin synthase-like enzyme
MSKLTETDLANDGKTVFFDQRVQLQFFDLIESARESIIFVTPYIDLWENLKRALREAVERGINVTFFVRVDQHTREPEDVQWLQDNKIKVHPVQNLHAKIYLNERTVLISSMNILRSSIMDSKEFAMIVMNEADKKMFRDYVSGLIPKSTAQSSHSVGNYVSGLIAKATAAQSSRPTERQTLQTATCIRCGDNIRFNTDKPLCADCYKEWAKYKKEDYPEKYCHSCGKLAKTTFEKPECLVCWKKSN